MKTFFKLLVLLGVVAYLFYVFADISGKRDSTRCKEVNVIIVDSSYAGFINADEVVRILKKEKIYPVGQLMEEVNGDSLEKALEKNSFVSIVKCYKTPGGRVNINISQRLLILRIKADNGDDYYIDNKGVAMMPENYTADVAVATGRISKRYAAKNLVHLARYLHTNDFANDLVEQINVAPDGRVALIPRIGCQVIQMGKLDSLTLRTQMQNLRVFYDKVLPTVGWNTYREISLEFNNQIVCKKN